MSPMIGKPKPPRPPDGMGGPKPPPMDEMPEPMEDQSKEDGGMAEIKDMLMKICQALGIEGYAEDGGEMPPDQPMPMGDEGE